MCCASCSRQLGAIKTSLVRTQFARYVLHGENGGSVVVARAAVVYFLLITDVLILLSLDCSSGNLSSISSSSISRLCVRKRHTEAENGIYGISLFGRFGVLCLEELVSFPIVASSSLKSSSIPFYGFFARYCGHASNGVNRRKTLYRDRKRYLSVWYVLRQLAENPVSYTHLTLPTIYSV